MTSRITRSIGCVSRVANISSPFFATETTCRCLRKNSVNRDRISSSSSTSSNRDTEDRLQGHHARLAGECPDMASVFQYVCIVAPASWMSHLASNLQGHAPGVEAPQADAEQYRPRQHQPAHKSVESA